MTFQTSVLQSSNWYSSYRSRLYVFNLANRKHDLSIAIMYFTWKEKNKILLKRRFILSLILPQNNNWSGQVVSCEKNEMTQF